jgi:hypothetical protein
MTGNGANHGSGSDSLQQRLESLPGVESADLSALPETIRIRARSAEVADLLGESLAALVRAEAGVEAGVQIEIASATETASPRRARFESLHVTQPTAGWLEARVELDWKGTPFIGESDGEYNLAGELRVCASAALRAVEQIADSSVHFTLVGVKELRVFDHDLIVVLLNTEDLPEQRLIGTALITQNRRHAATLAALNAINRVMGRFVEG